MRARRHLVTVAALVACAALPLSMPSSAEGREPLPSNISLGEPPKSNAPAALSLGARTKKLNTLLPGVTIPAKALGTPTTVSPRNLYVSANAYADVTEALVRPGHGTTGWAYLSRRRTEQHADGSVALTFRAAANKLYLIDCSVANGQSFEVRVGTTVSNIAQSDGHLLMTVPKRPADTTTRVEFRTPNASFERFGCEIIPVDQ